MLILAVSCSAGLKVEVTSTVLFFPVSTCACEYKLKKKTQIPKIKNLFRRLFIIVIIYLCCQLLFDSYHPYRTIDLLDMTCVLLADLTTLAFFFYDPTKFA